MGEASVLRRCAVPCFETNGFSELGCKGLWSCGSIACCLGVVNCQPSSSLAARVVDLFSGGFLLKKQLVCCGLSGFQRETVLGDHLPTLIIETDIAFSLISSSGTAQLLLSCRLSCFFNVALSTLFPLF